MGDDLNQSKEQNCASRRTAIKIDLFFFGQSIKIKKLKRDHDNELCNSRSKWQQFLFNKGHEQLCLSLVKRSNEFLPLLFTLWGFFRPPCLIEIRCHPANICLVKYQLNILPLLSLNHFVHLLLLKFREPLQWIYTGLHNLTPEFMEKYRRDTFLFLLRFSEVLHTNLHPR